MKVLVLFALAIFVAFGLALEGEDAVSNVSAKQLFQENLGEIQLRIEDIDLEKLREEMTEIFRKRKRGEIDRDIITYKRRLENDIGGDLIKALDPSLISVEENSVTITLKHSLFPVHVAAVMDGVTQDEYDALLRKQFRDAAKGASVRRLYLFDKWGDHFVLYAFPEAD